MGNQPNSPGEVLSVTVAAPAPQIDASAAALGSREVFLVLEGSRTLAGFQHPVCLSEVEWWQVAGAEHGTLPAKVCPCIHLGGLEWQGAWAGGCMLGAVGRKPVPAVTVGWSMALAGLPLTPKAETADATASSISPSALRGLSPFACPTRPEPPHFPGGTRSPGG